MKRFLVFLVASMFLVGSAYSQRVPSRPPWGDVCCGGPCCLKPPHPRR